MKTLLSLASVLVLSAAPAMAGDGHVSSQSLAKMGLSGMHSMTDAQGTQIRGLSIAVAAGGSIAFLGVPGGGAASVNTYFAAGSKSERQQRQLRGRRRCHQPWYHRRRRGRWRFVERDGQVIRSLASGPSLDGRARGNRATSPKVASFLRIENASFPNRTGRFFARARRLDRDCLRTLPI